MMEGPTFAPASVPPRMEPEPEPEPRSQHSDDPLQIAAQFFDEMRSGGVGKNVCAYALVPGVRAADEYAFPCRCQPTTNDCPKCRLQLPDEQLPDGKRRLPDCDCDCTGSSVGLHC